MGPDESPVEHTAFEGDPQGLRGCMRLLIDMMELILSELALTRALWPTGSLASRTRAAATSPSASCIQFAALSGILPCPAAEIAMLRRAAGSLLARGACLAQGAAVQAELLQG